MLGSTHGMHFFGKCYENGIGCETNMSNALLWYGRSADKGNKSAQKDLKRLENKSNKTSNPQ